jgi:hypothetical protein
MQIGGGRGTALPPPLRIVELRDLIKADAFGVAVVEIVAEAILPPRRRLDEGASDGARAQLIGHLERT